MREMFDRTNAEEMGTDADADTPRTIKTGPFVRQCCQCRHIFNEATQTYEAVTPEVSRILLDAHRLGACEITHGYCPACIDVLMREDELPPPRFHHSLVEGAV